MLKFYDKDLKPLSMAEHLKLFSDPAYRNVARSELGPGVTITTIWLGVCGCSCPHVFESQVIYYDEIFLMRYKDMEEAMEGHSTWVMELRNRLRA